MGPSGSGKDTLINWLADNLVSDNKIMFVRRTVTRDKDSSSEDHQTLSADQFDAVERAGKFAVTWNAHGLRYGIPIAALAHINTGGIAIANGSRRALPELAKVFGDILVINLNVDRAILAARLAARGREDAEQIQRRLSRMETPIGEQFETNQIDNSGDIDLAGNAVLSVIASLLQKSSDANYG